MLLSQTAPPNILKAIEKIRHPIKVHPLKPDRNHVADAFYEAEFLADRVIYYQREVPKKLNRRENLDQNKNTCSRQYHFEPKGMGSQEDIPKKE